MEQFGRYLLLERIARGGMAEVHRAAAVGTGFSKMVALKMILPEHAEDPTVAALMIEEAKIASVLRHPNVVRVLDLGIRSGRHFIVMDHVAGQPVHSVILSAVRSRRPLDYAFTLNVVMQALRGLQYAHEKTDARGRPLQIIHRDVSPQNIMVGYDGVVCLLDFGIARAAHTVSMTRAGVLRGKTGYISPEVVRGGAFTQAVDLYAMAVVLHELIALRRMRTPRNNAAALEEAATGMVKRFDQLGMDVPEVLANVVYKALSPDEDDRYQTAAEFLAALEEVARHFPAWDAPQTRALMADLFPQALEEEREAAARFEPLLEQLAVAPSVTPAPFPAAVSTPPPLPVRRPTPPPIPADITADIPLPAPRRVTVRDRVVAFVTRTRAHLPRWSLFR
jgi:serine/threonine-protein kinase